jgi:hypothetical protein
MSAPALAAIRIYPIKALDAVSLPRARLLDGGALEGDRRLALFDDDGKYINGKRCPEIHRVRARYDLAADTVLLSAHAGSKEHPFSMTHECDDMATWLGEALGRRVEIRRDERGGFPDDQDAPGPTIVGTASLEAVAAWFPGLSVESARRRFRSNLEIAGTQPFWEDGLYGEVGAAVRFRIGDVTIEGTNPCQRCVVPTHDPDTGETWPGFQAVFRERRRESLPAWATLARFDHFYRFAVNTRVPVGQVGMTIAVGDPVG